MRVLYVIDSLSAGGAETSLAEVAGGYRDVGIELHVAFLRDRWDVADRLTDAGARLVPVALDADRATQVRELTRVVRRLDPDLVHTTLYEADVLGRTAAALSRRPSVSTFAASAYSSDHYANPSISKVRLAAAQAVDVATARLARRFHAVSSEVALDMGRRLGIPAHRIVVVPRARDRSRLGEPTPERRGSARASLGLSDDQRVALVVARHEYEKGIDLALRALAEVRDRRPGLVLLVAGREGRETPTLTGLIRDLGLDDSVRLLGRRSDVPDLVVASDVVLVASRTEGFPGAVVEAMALERPVVGSDIPAVREVLGDVPSWLAPVGDVPRLARALTQALADPSASRAAGEAGRSRFDEEFTPLPVAQKMRAFYESALTPAKAPSP